MNINEAAKHNKTYRTALWTGNHLQVTLMRSNVGEDIGLEIHPNVDQFVWELLKRALKAIKQAVRYHDLNYKNP